MTTNTEYGRDHEGVDRRLFTTDAANWALVWHAEENNGE
jgi:hypothetical protein